MDFVETSMETQTMTSTPQVEPLSHLQMFLGHPGRCLATTHAVMDAAPPVHSALMTNLPGLSVR